MVSKLNSTDRRDAITSGDSRAAATYHRQGLLAQQQGRFQEAVSLLSAATALSPCNSKLHDSLGIAHVLCGNPDLAEHSFRAAIERSPELACAHFHLGMCLLQMGLFDEGWREFEWRWRLPSAASYRRAFAGLERGVAWEGKRVLLCAEQGMGTVIQFIRYAPVLAQGGAEVYLECARELKPLLSSVPGLSKALGPDDALSEYDWQIPLLSVPHLVGTTIDTVPSSMSYLSADPVRQARWRSRLRREGEFVVAIAWQGNPGFPFDRDRSVPLKNFEPLASIPGVRLISVQKHNGVDQLRDGQTAFPCQDLSQDLDSDGAFLDTAAVLREVDLTITSDTSIAHLAGALAVPVWVALSFAADWRWLINRSDSPWYPSMRLFRQTASREWSTVFQQMTEALQERVHGPSSAETHESFASYDSARVAKLDLSTGHGGGNSSPFGYFGTAYVLNLDSDVDRMRRVEARLNHLRIPHQRFPALVSPPGLRSNDPRFTAAHYACGLTHRAVLQDAWDRGLSTVLIFEDDVVLRDDSPEWMGRIIPQLEKINWDVFYLGLHLARPGKPYGANLLEVKLGFHAHAYAVARHAIPKLIGCIDRTLARCTGVFDIFDDTSLLKVCAVPILAIQEPNHSYTHGTRVDRTAQYFTIFDREDFRRHCAEMIEIEKSPS